MKRRRRKWRAPNDPTGPARQLWAALFPGHPWPKGWRVQWAGFMRGALGLTIYQERRVLLSWGDFNGPALITSRTRRLVTASDLTPRAVTSPRPQVLDTMLHEFVHMRAGHTLRHGAEFRRLENGLRERLGLAPERGTP